MDRVKRGNYAFLMESTMLDYVRSKKHKNRPSCLFKKIIMFIFILNHLDLICVETQVVQRDCNLTQIGGLLDSKGYGIATPKVFDENQCIGRMLSS